MLPQFYWFILFAQKKTAINWCRVYYSLQTNSNNHVIPWLYHCYAMVIPLLCHGCARVIPLYQITSSPNSEKIRSLLSFSFAFSASLDDRFLRFSGALSASMLRHPLLSYDGYSLGISGQRLGRKSCPSTPSKISKWKILGLYQFHVSMMSMVHVHFFGQGRSPKELHGFFCHPKTSWAWLIISSTIIWFFMMVGKPNSSPFGSPHNSYDS